MFLFFAGGTGTDIHGDLHHRDVQSDPCHGIHSTQKLLHEEPLEHHGLLRCCLRVSRNFRLELLKNNV